MRCVNGTGCHLALLVHRPVTPRSCSLRVDWLLGMLVTLSRACPISDQRCESRLRRMAAFDAQIKAKFASLLGQVRRGQVRHGRSQVPHQTYLSLYCREVATNRIQGQVKTSFVTLLRSIQLGRFYLLQTVSSSGDRSLSPCSCTVSDPARH